MSASCNRHVEGATSMNAHSQTTNTAAYANRIAEDRYFDLEPMLRDLAIRATAMDRVKDFIRDELADASRREDLAVLGQTLQSLNYDIRVLMEFITDVAIMARGVEAAYNGEKAPLLLI